MGLIRGNLMKKSDDYEKYEKLNDDEVIDLLYDELPQNSDCKCGDYYEHELSGITFEIDYVHMEEANFCGCNWVVSERPDLVNMKNEEMIERDLVSDYNENLYSHTKAKNPFTIENSFNPLLGYGFG